MKSERNNKPMLFKELYVRKRIKTKSAKEMEYNVLYLEKIKYFKLLFIPNKNPTENSKSLLSNKKLVREKKTCIKRTKSVNFVSELFCINIKTTKEKIKDENKNKMLLKKLNNGTLFSISISIKPLLKSAKTYPFNFMGFITFKTTKKISATTKVIVIQLLFKKTLCTGSIVY